MSLVRRVSGEWMWVDFSGRKVEWWKVEQVFMERDKKGKHTNFSWGLPLMSQKLSKRALLKLSCDSFKIKVWALGEYPVWTKSLVSNNYFGEVNQSRQFKARPSLYESTGLRCHSYKVSLQSFSNVIYIIYLRKIKEKYALATAENTHY